MASIEKMLLEFCLSAFVVNVNYFNFFCCSILLMHMWEDVNRCKFTVAVAQMTEQSSRDQKVPGSIPDPAVNISKCP